MAVDDSYTKSLLHFDGSDGSTTFTDESGKSWTVFGNARIATAQSKFGGAAGFFDGSGDYISTPTDADFNMYSNDWTVDYWIYPTTVTGIHTHAHFYNGAGGVGNLGLHIYQDGTNLKVDNGNAASGLSAGTLVINTWKHVAIVNNGGTILMFLNGTQIDSEAKQNYGNASSNCMIGRHSAASPGPNLAGYMDEFRVSKGVARWTSNFTPPTSAYGQATIISIYPKIMWI